MAAAYKRKQVRVIMLVNVKTESLSGGYLLNRPRPRFSGFRWSPSLVRLIC